MDIGKQGLFSVNVTYIKEGGKRVPDKPNTPMNCKLVLFMQ